MDSINVDLPAGWKADLRKTSEQDMVPWLLSTLTFILIDVAAGTITQAKEPTKKLALLKQARLNELGILLVAWPGQWTQDIFLVDEYTEPYEALEA